jgi:hypothetical protein
MQSYKSEGFDKGREQQQMAKLGSFTQVWLVNLVRPSKIQNNLSRLSLI